MKFGGKVTETATVCLYNAQSDDSMADMQLIEFIQLFTSAIPDTSKIGYIGGRTSDESPILFLNEFGISVWQLATQEAKEYTSVGSDKGVTLISDSGEKRDLGKFAIPTEGMQAATFLKALDERLMLIATPSPSRNGDGNKKDGFNKKLLALPLLAVALFATRSYWKPKLFA